MSVPIYSLPLACLPGYPTTSVLVFILLLLFCNSSCLALLLICPPFFCAGVPVTCSCGVCHPRVPLLPFPLVPPNLSSPLQTLLMPISTFPTKISTSWYMHLVGGPSIHPMGIPRPLSLAGNGLVGLGFQITFVINVILNDVLLFFFFFLLSLFFFLFSFPAAFQEMAALLNLSFLQATQLVGWLTCHVHRLLLLQ